MADDQPRKWISVAEGEKLLKVMSFNMLADGLAQSGSFAYAPKYVLEFDSRIMLVLSEIDRVCADIVGLAECSHFDDKILPMCKTFGLTGVFIAKINSPAMKMSFPPDGVALLWRESLWKEVSIARFDNNPVQIIAVLQSRNIPELTVVVSMMHLAAKNAPGRAEKRAQQVITALKRLDEIKTDDAHIIFCGDFNAEKGEQSLATVYEAGFTNAYDSVVMPLWTTWKIRKHGDELNEVKRIIDYIFVSPSLYATALLLPPSDEVVGKNALPNSNYPSDHIAIAAEFSSRKVKK